MELRTIEADDLGVVPTRSIIKLNMGAPIERLID
tara:strand:- start:1922 stop:2023 length:102 start_codon:yes stop_codon:yes gene_type:complete